MFDNNDQQVDYRSLDYVYGDNDNLPDHFICPICRCVLVDPHSTGCGHTFCGDCLAEVVSSSCNLHSTSETSTMQSELHSFPCPVDRQAVTELFRAPYILTSLLDDLKVRCPYSSSGCEFVDSRCFLNSHLTHSCKYIPVSCGGIDKISKNRCQELVERRFAATNPTSICDHTRVTCVCGEDIPSSFLTNHLKNECSVTVHACECGVDVVACDMKKHKETCPEMPIPCSAEAYGCRWKGIRKDTEVYAKHTAECRYVFVGPVLEHQNDRINKLEKENQVLKSRIKDQDMHLPLDQWLLQRRNRSIRSSSAGSRISNTGNYGPEAGRNTSISPRNSLIQDEALELDSNGQIDVGWVAQTVQRLSEESDQLRRDNDRLVQRVDVTDFMQHRFFLQEIQRLSEESSLLRLGLSSVRQQLNFLFSERKTGFVSSKIPESTLRHMRGTNDEIMRARTH